MEPSCLLLEGDIIGHTWMEAILCMAGGYDVEVCEEVSRPPWLVGDKIMDIHCKAPGPIYKWRRASSWAS